MNFRCQHIFAQAQNNNKSFGHYYVKNEKIVTLTNYFIHPFPCFGRLTAVNT